MRPRFVGRLQAARLIGAATLALACACPALGELEYGGGYSAAWDSNITLSPVPTPDQTHTGFVGLAYQEQSVAVTARVIAQAEARHFVNDTFSDDTYAYLDANVVWTVLPKRFSWMVNDLYRQTLVNLRQPDTPNNYVETNSFDTGPDLTFQLSPSNSIGVLARYGKYSISGPGDNDRISGAVSFAHSLSPTSSLSVNYQGTQMRFQPPALYERISREDFFALYQAQPSLLNQTIAEIGATRVDPMGGVTHTGHRVLFSFVRQLTHDSSLRIALADVLTDTFTDLLGRSETFQVADALGDIYKRQSGALGYTMSGPRLGFTPVVFVNKVDYDTLPQDYEELGARIGLTWQFSAGLRGGAFTSYLKRKFLSFERTDVETEANINVTYLLSRSLSVTLERTREETNSTDPTISYVNNRWMLLLGYSTGPTYIARSRR